MMCLHLIRIAHMVYNINCLTETEELLKVTGSSHVHGKSGNISETEQHRDVSLQIADANRK